MVMLWTIIPIRVKLAWFIGHIYPLYVTFSYKILKIKNSQNYSNH